MVRSADALYMALAKADAIRERIEDGELRLLAEKVMAVINEFGTSRAPEGHEARMNAVTRAFREMDRRLGEIYRAI
jgi:hypothetical protein